MKLLKRGFANPAVAIALGLATATACGAWAFSSGRPAALAQAAGTVATAQPSLVASRPDVVRAALLSGLTPDVLAAVGLDAAETTAWLDRLREEPRVVSNLIAAENRRKLAEAALATAKRTVLRAPTGERDAASARLTEATSVLQAREEDLVTAKSAVVVVARGSLSPASVKTLQRICDPCHSVRALPAPYRLCAGEAGRTAGISISELRNVLHENSFCQSARRGLKADHRTALNQADQVAGVAASSASVMQNLAPVMSVFAEWGR